MDESWTVGLYQGGASLLPLVWEQATIRFSVDPDHAHLASKFPQRPPALDWNDTPLRSPLSILQTFPVDVLILDHSQDYSVARTVKGGPVWYKWLGVSEHLSCLPRVVVQVWQTWASGSEQGPLGATQRKFMHRLGYETRYAILDAVEYGSPVQQSRLIVFGYLRGCYPALIGEPWMLPVSDGLPPRPMSNCLRPFGAGPTVKAPTDGELPISTVPKSVSDLMPSRAGAWIQVPSGGYRRLFANELAKGLGVPQKWNSADKKYLSSHTFDHLPGSHVWETLGVSLESFLSQQTAVSLRHATMCTQDDSPDGTQNTKGAFKTPDAHRGNALLQEVSAPFLSPVQKNLHCRAPDRLQSACVETAPCPKAPQTTIAHVSTCAPARPPIEVATKVDKSSQPSVYIVDSTRKPES